MQKPNKPITICIPSYNSENKILPLIESIYQQTIQDFEVYIFDNHSTDQTPEICKILTQDPRFHYVRRLINIGPYRNLFKALNSQSTGYLALIADDMQIEPTYLEECLKAYQEYPDTIHVYTGVYLHRNEQCIPRFDPYRLDQSSVEERMISLVKNLSLGTAIYGLFNTAYMSMIDKVWDLDSFMRLGDSVLLMKLLNYGKIRQINRPLIHRRLVDEPMEYNARLEQFFYGGYKRLSMPIVKGIFNHYEFLLGNESQAENKASFAQKIVSLLLQKHKGQVEQELQYVAKHLQQNKIFQTFDGTYEPVKELEPFIYLDLLKYLKLIDQITPNHLTSHLIQLCLKKL